MTWEKPDPTAPDPGPRPEPKENLTQDQLIAEYASDLKDENIWEEIKRKRIKDAKVTIASNRKSKIDKDAEDKWMSAYIKRYGTDEG